MKSNFDFHTLSYHPREGGGPASGEVANIYGARSAQGEAAIYKGRLTATDQTPAFAGVAMWGRCI